MTTKSMLRALRSPLAAALPFGVVPHARRGLPKEIAITKSGHLASYDANIAAVEQLVKETNAGDDIEKGAFERLKRGVSLRCTRDDHLPSGLCWYIYEYSDRGPKLLKLVKPAHMPGYEQ